MHIFDLLFISTSPTYTGMYVHIYMHTSLYQVSVLSKCTNMHKII